MDNALIDYEAKLYANPPSKVLCVDDEQSYLQTVTFSLSGVEIFNQPLVILTARSAEEARKVLLQHPDISIILLDVVMEDDNAGLLLINHIRRELQNHAVRIVLLTGQPGMAPYVDVMANYDIDEYWHKLELSAEQLTGIVKSNIRTWRYINQINNAENGLRSIVNASRDLSGIKDINAFSNGVLDAIGGLIGHQHQGILCLEYNPDAPKLKSRIIAATGIYQSDNHTTLQDLWPMPQGKMLIDAFQRASRCKGHIFAESYSLLFFGNTLTNQNQYMTFVDSNQPLSGDLISLLIVFSENIASGFSNIQLYNRLTDLAFKDHLTGLHNRHWLCNEIDNMSEAQRSSAMLMLFSPDDFNHISLTFGEAFGDQLIISLSKNLLVKIADGYGLSRISPNTLALLISQEKLPTQAVIQDICDYKMEISGIEHFMAVTVVELGFDALQEPSAEYILGLGECSIDQARASHKEYASFDANFSIQIAERFELLDKLRSALVQEEFHLAFQPKVELESGKVIGFEALIRWQDTNGTNIPPIDFIPLAEASGLIGKLDKFVLRRVCEAAVDLQSKGWSLPIALNAATSELLEHHYFDDLLETITSFGLSPSQLELEITESQAIMDYEKIAPQIKRLIELGMTVSIDDFGTGYSSLAHITDLDATCLKIDKSFVQDLETNSDKALIVDTIISLSDNFGFNVVAEGIETQQQLDILKAKGCHTGQGYYFAKPMPLDELIVWLNQYTQQLQ